MDPTKYQLAAIRTECDQDKPREHMTKPPDMIRLNHAVLGLNAESGELASWFLKVVYYGKPMDHGIRLKMIEELGDILWFVAQAATVLGKDLGEIMQENIAKLRARYPDKFTEELSANRDEAKEREAIDRASKSKSLSHHAIEAQRKADEEYRVRLEVCSKIGHHFVDGECVRCGQPSPDQGCK